MKFHAAFISLILSCLFLSGCGDGAHAESPLVPVQVEFEVIHSGDGTGSIDGEDIANKRIMVLADQDALENQLYMHTQHLSNYETPATVDFSSSQVLLVNIGSRSTGGYDIEVDGVEYSLDERYVIAEITLLIPSDGCTVTTALTSPYLFVEVESSKQIIVREYIEYYECV